MKLIIDGYNLLKNIVGADFVEEQKRNAFITQLAEYSHKKKLPIVVVFDGGTSIFASFERHNGVEVVYSGARENADEYIKRYVEDVEPNNYLLISSDKELVNYVQYHGVDALDSQAFYGFMQEALIEQAPEPMVKRIKGKAKKLHPEESDSELDTLMQKASEVIVRKQEDRTTDDFVPSPAQKIKQKDRMRALKLKKL